MYVRIKSDSSNRVMRSYKKKSNDSVREIVIQKELRAYKKNYTNYFIKGAGKKEVISVI